MKLKTLRKYWKDGFNTAEAFLIHKELEKAKKELGERYANTINN